jgi:hypothetical protein
MVISISTAMSSAGKRFSLRIVLPGGKEKRRVTHIPYKEVHRAEKLCMVPTKENQANILPTYTSTSFPYQPLL